MGVTSTREWKALQEHARTIAGLHLRDLLKDEERCRKMTAEYDGIFLDYSRQNATLETVKLLFDLARARNVEGKIKEMAAAKRINTSEDRAVLHLSLRAPKSQSIMLDGSDTVKDVH